MTTTRRLFLLLALAAGTSTLSPARAAAQGVSLNRAMALSDPNRDPAWDWTDPGVHTLYVINLGAVPTQLPYFSGRGPAGIDLATPDPDISAADGWVLVARDFGTPGLPVQMPFYILYNKYRGFLRLFFWNSLDTTFSRAAAKLAFQGSTPDTTAALMTFSGPDPEYVNAYNPSKAQIALADIAPRQWGYFDFDVSGYDPRISQKVDPTFTFVVRGMVDTSITLEGTIETNKGTATVQNSADTFAAVKGLYDKPAKRYKQVEDARKKLTEEADKNPNAWWADYAKSIAGLLGSQWVKGLAPIVGFVEAVLGFGSRGDKGGPLMIDATVKLAGNLTTQTTLFDFILRVPGAYHANPVLDAQTNKLPLYDRPLGIFNLMDPPTVEVAQERRTWTCQPPPNPDGSYCPPGCLYCGYCAPPPREVNSCVTTIQQRLSRVDYVVNPDAGLVLDALDAAYLPSAGGLPEFYVAGVSDGYRRLCELQQAVLRDSYGCPGTGGSLYCPETIPPDPSVRRRDIALRVRLRAPAAPGDLEPTLLLRKYRPTLVNVGFPLNAPDACAVSPFVYSTARDQHFACLGIAGGGSWNCSYVGDANDRRLCSGMADHMQSPCTQITDRSLQLACYGLSVAPSYPSNCRDIVNPEMRDFCYSVASGGSWASCSSVSDPSSRALCQALSYGNVGYCDAIPADNDRWFCYGTAGRLGAYCDNIAYCDANQRQSCLDQGGQWDSFYCSCTLPPTCDPWPESQCYQSGGSWDPVYCYCYGGCGNALFCEPQRIESLGPGTAIAPNTSQTPR